MIKTKRYKASEIAEIVGGKLVGEDRIIEYISFDSREENEVPFLFFPIKGKKYDAEEFVEQAINNGAKIVVTKQIRVCSCSIILVEDTNEALFKLAHFNIGNTKVIGVTGSNGKTTVKEMIYCVLSQKYRVSATKENLNNEIGVSQTLLSIIDEEYCVVEMGMRGKGEIAFLAKLANPSICVITNAGSAHLEKLGSKKNIFYAKCEILKYTKDVAILPNERRFRKVSKNVARCVYIGASGELDADNKNQDSYGIKYEITVRDSDKKISAYIHSIYEHDIRNSLFAFAVGKACNIPEKDIIQGIFEFKNFKNRGSVIKIGEITLIDDSYNSSYESLKSTVIGALEISKIEKKNLYVVLGDMLEIGKKSKKYHKKIGKFLRKNDIFNVISIGKYSKCIIKGFRDGIICQTIEEIIHFISKNLSKEDMVFLKASRKMHFEKIIEGLKNNEN